MTPAPDEAKKKEHRGVRFALRDGPCDGDIVRLFPGPYPGIKDSCGWDYLPHDDGRYVRPDDSNPYMKTPAKVNKGHDNIPYMQWSGRG